jgi:hypothetical protein
MKREDAGIKKLLWFCIALGLVVTGKIFPIDITGNIWTGVWYHTTDEEDTEPKIELHSTEAFSPLKLELYLNQHSGAFGISANLYADFSSWSSHGDVMWGHAQLYYKLFENSLTISAGTVYDGTYDTKGALQYTKFGQGHDGLLNNGPGVHATYQISPLIFAGGSVLVDVGGEWKDVGYCLAGLYIVPNIAEIVGGFRSHDPRSSAENDFSTWIGVRLPYFQYFGFSQFVLDSFVYNIGEDFIKDSESTGKVEVGELMVWNHNDLQLGGRLRQRFYMGGQAVTDTYIPDLNFWLWVKYKFLYGRLTPGVDAVYILGSNPRNDFFTDPGLVRWDSHNKNQGGFLLRALVELAFWNVDSKIELGYVFAKDLSSYRIKPKTTMDHAIYVGFKMHF